MADPTPRLWLRFAAFAVAAQVFVVVDAGVLPAGPQAYAARTDVKWASDSSLSFGAAASLKAKKWFYTDFPGASTEAPRRARGRWKWPAVNGQQHAATSNGCLGQRRNTAMRRTAAPRTSAAP